MEKQPNPNYVNQQNAEALAYNTLQGRDEMNQEYQPIITTRIYVLHKITIALKFMSYINSDLPVPVKKLQAPG